jgi:signal transduction histidine kinase
MNATVHYSNHKAQPEQLMENRDRLVDMLAFSGHELNNTLTRLVLSVETLMRDTTLLLTEQQQHYIENVALNTRLLKSIANSYIALARLEDKSLQLNTTPLDPVCTIIEPLVKTYADIMWEQHQTCELRTSCTGVELYADSALLTSAFDNLLNNAIKYGEPGSQILITVDRNGSCLEVCFRNRAKEINAEVLGQMFNRFARGPNVKNQSGSGIGLYLVKRAVEAHSGSVQVETHLRGEVRFKVSLPVLNS